MSNLFHLQIATPERMFLDREVEALIVTCPDGEVGILKNHEPMVNTLSIGTVRIKYDGKWHEAAGSEGFIQVRPDVTVMLAQTMEWPDEIDERRARESIERNEEEMRQKKSLQEYLQSKASLTRALVRLRVRQHTMNDTE